MGHAVVERTKRDNNMKTNDTEAAQMLFKLQQMTHLSGAIRELCPTLRRKWKRIGTLKNWAVIAENLLFVFKYEYWDNGLGDESWSQNPHHAWQAL